MARRAAPTKLLIDNSVWSRLRHPDVRVALITIVEAHRPDALMICPAIAAEVGFSARSPSEHTQLIAELAAYQECPTPPTSTDVLELQNRLWRRGLVRGVGATDTLIAAYALRNNAMVLHYDSDFEHIATVAPAFTHAWIVPRGTL